MNGASRWLEAMAPPAATNNRQALASCPYFVFMVDVETAAARVARVDREFDRLAAPPHIHEDALHALLVKLVVVAKAHQVLQQPLLVDLRAGVADLHAAPVGLAGDQAVAFEQVAG